MPPEPNSVRPVVATMHKEKHAKTGPEEQRAFVFKDLRSRLRS